MKIKVTSPGVQVIQTQAPKSPPLPKDGKVVPWIPPGGRANVPNEKVRDMPDAPIHTGPGYDDPKGYRAVGSKPKGYTKA